MGNLESGEIDISQQTSEDDIQIARRYEDDYKDFVEKVRGNIRS